MTTVTIGTTFPSQYQWSQNEKQLVSTIQAQIQVTWPSLDNLLINTTWFGPQFDNDQYQKFVEICATRKFDQLFLLAGVDPVCLTDEQIHRCQEIAGAQELYLLGNFDSKHQFNFISTLLPYYFEQYSEQQLLPTKFEYCFLNYNRKPHPHRVDFVNLLEHNQLLNRGIVTLGNRYTLSEQPNTGNWEMDMALGIPHDIHTLGDLNRWRSHFLNIVSETINLPWNPLFVTEKTFKPIIGLRPFVINGQPKIYNWLRKNGFRTFNHHWPQVDLENATEYNTAERIVDVIKYLSTRDLVDLYQQMLPDLLHNRKHLAEFITQQQTRINHLFI
jgi:hypothetical protein